MVWEPKLLADKIESAVAGKSNSVDRNRWILTFNEISEKYLKEFET